MNLLRVIAEITRATKTKEENEEEVWVDNATVFATTTLCCLFLLLTCDNIRCANIELLLVATTMLCCCVASQLLTAKYYVSMELNRRWYPILGTWIFAGLNPALRQNTFGYTNFWCREDFDLEKILNLCEHSHIDPICRKWDVNMLLIVLIGILKLKNLRQIHQW